MRTIEVAPSRRRAAPPRAAIRVRPVPWADPPFDDEAETWSGPRFPWGARVPAGDSGRAAPTAAEAAAGPAAGLDAAGSAAPDGVDTAGCGARPAAGPPPVVAGASTDARRAVHRFVGVLLEVLNGYRPPAHLRPLCRPVDAAEIIAHTRAAMHRIAEARRLGGTATRSGPAGRSAPGPAGLAATSRSAQRVAHRADRHGRRPDPAAVLRLRICEPRRGSVEATVLLVTAARTWALALRLDGGPDTWVTSVARLL